MPSRRGLLAGAASGLASGLAGCLVGARRPGPGIRALAGRSGSTAPDRSGAAPPDPDGGATSRTYGWSHDGRTYSLDVAVPAWLLAYDRARPRVRDRGAYVADPYHDALLDSVARGLVERAPTSGAVLGLARTFVQGVPYETDAASTGRTSYPRYPAETLAAGRADCEDAAVLLAGLLDRLDHESVLLAFWDADHMALGLATDQPVDARGYAHDGRRYAYLETASPGWGVGEVPDLVGTERPEVMPVDRRPTLVTDWTTERARGGLRGQTVVRNVGDGPASEVRVRLRLRAAGGEPLATGSSRATDVAAGGSAALSATVWPPDATPAGARLEVLDGGEVVDAVALAGSDDATPGTGVATAHPSR